MSGNDILGVCLGISLVMMVYGYIKPRLEVAKSLERIGRMWESRPMSPVFFDYPDGKSVECRLFLETDETGTTVLVAKPIEEKDRSTNGKAESRVAGSN